jgi:protein-tyrosine sulfotransferase
LTDSEDQGPVIVLAFAQSGAAHLQDLLAASAALTCTTATGLLPLCEQAAAVWRRVNNRDDSLSHLAVASIRALSGTMMSTILASTGRLRWCETIFVSPESAETFLRIYPETKFVCLYRSCLEVVRAGIQVNPWGLVGTPFAMFSTTYPASSSAAIAAYWAWCTELLLKFEHDYPGKCHRIKYEDLVRDPGRVSGDVFAFLNLAQDNPTMPHLMSDSATGLVEGAELADSNVSLVTDQIPMPLRRRVNDLQERLGYVQF